MEQNTRTASGDILDSPAESTTSPTHKNMPDQPGSAAQQTGAAQETDAEKKPSWLKRMWTKSGLDTITILLMFKASLPPIIAIACYQAPAFATQYGTLGYLVAITSILAFCIMPRGKFVQTMILNIIAICLAASVNLLALYCAIHARLHTTPAGRPPTGYNSSASAVLAIWLIFQTYLINCLRAARPQFQFPAILYSIFVAVSSTYGTQFPTMTYAISFMKMLLETFLTGFAIATGVSLFIIPMSSRQVVFKEMTGYLSCLGGMLKAQTAYMQSLEALDPIAARQQESAQREGKNGKQKSEAQSGQNGIFMTPQARKVQEMLSKTFDLHTKIPGDLVFAKREMAIGKLDGKDLKQMWKLLQKQMIPVIGLSTIIDVLRRRAGALGFSNEDPSEQETLVQNRHIENIHYLMRTLHEPFDTMTAHINEAFQHVMITLELVKPPKKQKDEEAGNAPSPGSLEFAASFKDKVDAFYDSKKQSLRDWTRAHGIELPPDFFDSTFVQPEHLKPQNEHAREKNQRQLFFMLYLEYLLWRAGQAALELVLWADQKRADGTMKKARLIIPAAKTVRKWCASVFGKEDRSQEDHYTAEMDAGAMESLDLGQSFSRRKDPEHLPPANFFERLGDLIRGIPRFLRSDASAFGIRVACATMTVAIICYLEASQTWFLQNRLLWAMIMVSISMSRLAGQSIANFILRIIGTAIAMVGAYIIWYIVDGKTAGVIVFLWLWIFLAFYVVLKMPKLVIVGILSLVTAILIVGYELQVGVIGKDAIESNGQPAYPTYLLAPYRLATVAGGLGVAFIWTIFPYPISESTELRKDLGAALYLLANLYSIVHETVRLRITRDAGDAEIKGTRANHLEAARNTVFRKLIALVTQLKTNSAFSKFQLTIGGKFPREDYEALIENVQHLLQYCSLLSYASSTFSKSGDDSAWSKDFRALLTNNNHTSHQITSLLSLLSSSLLHGRALPPYLEIPPNSRFVKRLNAIDHDILSIRHIAEPEYSAFAVFQICAQCLYNDLTTATKHIKNLVGEIDFSFHAVSTERSSEETLDTISEKKLDNSAIE